MTRWKYYWPILCFDPSIGCPMLATRRCNLPSTAALIPRGRTLPARTSNATKKTEHTAVNSKFFTSSILFRKSTYNYEIFRLLWFPFLAVSFLSKCVFPSMTFHQPNRSNELLNCSTKWYYYGWKSHTQQQKTTLSFSMITTRNIKKMTESP